MSDKRKTIEFFGTPCHLAPFAENRPGSSARKTARARKSKIFRAGFRAPRDKIKIFLIPPEARFSTRKTIRARRGKKYFKTDVDTRGMLC
ncbi:MAG: hypothetical protein HYV14_05855 [Elusimicrobia bacterium]|nr:hypothetical protein [Elusimicrobiota bacterium]